MLHQTLKKIFVLLALFAGVSILAESYKPSSIIPPQPAREFRGAWVATVGNSVWPSRKGLTTEEQKAEMIALLDRAVKLKLNAIIFQVRPACDAMYPSKIEPWSEFLSGTMGDAPKPFYDPLEFAVSEAHKRGLELHAWFNPYRALHKVHEGRVSPNHISKTRPDLVRSYGSYLWLDPGEREVQDYSLRVVMDVVKRYDVDGVHFDDYFYPYQENGLDFPDDASWKKFGAGGKLSRADWRRENVNVFIQHVYQSIRATKPWMKFGVSPFGIWRPGFPQQIKGYDAYEKLYADSRKWLQNGWLDYFSPQLYWGIEPKEQSFPVLLNWWEQQNTKHRHIWPGLDATKTAPSSEGSREAKWKPEEIIEQIHITRQQTGAPGEVLWSMKSLMSNRGPLGDALAEQVFPEHALVPASPWLGTGLPRKPSIFVSGLLSGNLRLVWTQGGTNTISHCVIQLRTGKEWKIEIVPFSSGAQVLGDTKPEVIAVTAIDRVGNASLPAVVELREQDVHTKKKK